MGRWEKSEMVGLSGYLKLSRLLQILFQLKAGAFLRKDERKPRQPELLLVISLKNKSKSIKRNNCLWTFQSKSVQKTKIVNLLRAYSLCSPMEKDGGIRFFFFAQASSLPSPFHSKIVQGRIKFPKEQIHTVDGLGVVPGGWGWVWVRVLQLGDDFSQKYISVRNYLQYCDCVQIITNKLNMSCKSTQQFIRKTYNFQTAHQKEAKEASRLFQKAYTPPLNSSAQLKFTHSIKELQSKIEGVENLVKMKSSKIEAAQVSSAKEQKDAYSHGIRQFQKTKNLGNFNADKATHGAWMSNQSKYKPNELSFVRKPNRELSPNKYTEESPIKIPPLNLHAMSELPSSHLPSSTSSPYLASPPPRFLTKKIDQSKSFIDLPHTDLDTTLDLKDSRSISILLSGEQQTKSEFKLLNLPQKGEPKQEKATKMKGFNYDNIKNTINAYKTRNKSRVETRNTVIQGFEFGKVLGRGKFGEVYMAKHVDTGFIVAIKKVGKKILKEFKMIDQFVKEIKLHSKLDHPNIVRFYGFFEETDNIYLVLEYISGGTLFDFQNQIGVLSTKQAANFLKDIIDALTYLHERNIAHRDIKPENIVISSAGIAKLCDFGWSAVVQSMRETFCGTLDYASPEIILRKKYDTTIDLWCIGILTYELFVGRAPFEGSCRNETMQRIVNIDKTGIPFMETLPQQAKEFVEALLQKDPSMRPAITELFDFQLFSHASPSKHRNERSFFK